jgi:hypothetical protein
LRLAGCVKRLILPAKLGMILYNVTINIDDSIHDEWMLWMLNEHIPQVLDTGMFRNYRMFKVLTRQDEESGTTYCIQYFADTMSDYNFYIEEYAPKFRAETERKFSGKYVAFRTLLEEV